jgi:hypothetical protein
MKLPAGAGKWVLAVLGVVCLFLVANLVAQYRSWEPGKSHAAPARIQPSSPGKSSAQASGDLSQFDPSVHLDQLKSLDSRPLPPQDGNPFGGPGPAAVAQAAAAGPAPNQPPPPPPPPPLKAMGYNELPGGKKEAMVTYNDDLVVVHEGDTVGPKFKVLKIDPTKVVVEDGDTHQTLELPFPQ